jgi:azurin
MQPNSVTVGLNSLDKNQREQFEMNQIQLDRETVEFSLTLVKNGQLLLPLGVGRVATSEKK